MPSFENAVYFDEEALIDRLSDGLVECPKEVVFVVGAPLNSPEDETTPGVSSVSQIVDDIRERFSEGSSARNQLEIQINDSANKYQAAFQFLLGRRGQNACNAVIQTAVLRARSTNLTESNAVKVTDDELTIFDADDAGWHLSRGAEALGLLIAAQPSRFGRTLLTSNFDPLAKVAVRRAGGRVWQTTLVADADLGNTQAEGCRIVHFHGYWHGTDTLHTGTQLLQQRPSLKSSLLEYLKDRLVVVVAYGGWEDILTSALKDLTGNVSIFPEILWTFYDSAPVIPSHLRSVLQPGLDRGRVNLYAGINCHEFFPKLLEKWDHSGACTKTKKNNTQTSARFNISPSSLKQLECDRPPSIDTWVGREAELRSLDINIAPVSILCGIGGQGKSLTAAKYIKDTFESGSRFKFWDWRDCKEAADSIRTQVISAINRITAEETTSEMLVSASDADLADLLVECSAASKILFVFDNVDHYVDLENFRFTGLLDHLVQKFSSAETDSQLILTCRPQVRYPDPGIVTIPMSDLTLEETHSLFLQRGVPAHSATDNDIRCAHSITKGHPFWLDLMAAQVAQVPGLTLERLLEDFRRGREETPDVLHSIWGRLHEREQTLLRVMAEAVRPETRETLEKYAASLLRYNKFDKALRSLIKLNLVVVKPENNAPDLYDLHPLVRQFVRNHFSRGERQDYIRLLIGQYESMIQSLRKMLGFSMPLPMLGRWTQKAELEIEAQQYKAAAKSLSDAISALIGGGHSEEFVRVARILLEAVDWAVASSDIQEFDEILEHFISCLDDLGDHSGADAALDRLLTTIPEKTARYIKFCDLKCYSLWKRRRFDVAIEWGETGLELKKSTNVDTRYGTEHNLALARRDAGQVEKALEYFLGGSPLADFVDVHSTLHIDNGPKLGNIGRCLQLNGNTAEALFCYQKSIRALEASADANRLSNQSFARQWISECLVDQGKLELAYCFLISAEDLCSRFSPSRQSELRTAMQQLGPKLSEERRTISVSSANRKVRAWIHSAGC